MQSNFIVMQSNFIVMQSNFIVMQSKQDVSYVRYCHL